MDERLQAEVLTNALRKVVAALRGLQHEPVVIGALARQAWGLKRGVQGVELLIPSGKEHREAILSAARGEGFQQAPHRPAPPEAATLRLHYTDARLRGEVDVDLMEASTPFHKKVLSRAQREHVLQMQLRLATCEDLILWSAGSTLPADREIVVELLRATAGRIDAPYLKSEAEAAGVFVALKSAWQEARQQA